MRKKIFSHGGSKSVDLPMSFIYSLSSNYVNIEEQSDGTLLIRPVDELTSLESDPLFTQFLEALYLDTLKHPEKLKNIKEVWDEEWEQLLEGVDGGQE
jgi:virulence-associated protein VagC